MPSTRNQNVSTNPNRLESLAFYLGGNHIDSAPVLQEIEEHFTQESLEERQQSLRELRDLEAKRETAKKERPEAETVWQRVRKELGDTRPSVFQAVFLAIFAAFALFLDTLFLAPTMDILNVTSPVVQFFAAAGFAALCTAGFELNIIYYHSDSRIIRMIAIAGAGLMVFALIVWGLLRGYELRFAATLAENPLGQLLAEHPILAAAFYIFITVAMPVIGAFALYQVWRDVAAALTWQRARTRFEKLRTAEIELARKVLNATEALDHFDKRKEAECRRWKAVFAHYYERGRTHGARKESLRSVATKSAVGGVCASPLALLLPFAFIPALILFPVLAALALFVYFNHRRIHPTHDRYLAHENTQFAVDPDAPKPAPREYQKPELRLLGKGDEK